MKHFKSIARLICCLIIVGFYGCTSLRKSEVGPFYQSAYSDYIQSIDQALLASDNFSDSVIMIRNHAHIMYRCGRRVTDWETLGYAKVWEWSSEEWFEKFNTDLISTQCGGAASFLSSLYRDYGFTSFSISIGGRDTADKRGHIQVAVSNSKNCCPSLDSLFIMDPMFNFHYEKSGQLQSLDDMITSIALGQQDSLILVSGSEKGLHLQKSKIINPFLPEIDKSGTSEVFKSKNEVARYIVRAPRTIDKYLARGFNRLYTKILSEHGFDVRIKSSDDFKYTVLAIRGIYATCCSVSLMRSYTSKRDSCFEEIMLEKDNSETDAN